MRVGFIGDVHLSTKPWPGRVLSTQSRFYTGLNTLVLAAQKLIDAECELVVLLGDVFDTTKMPWDTVFVTVQQLLRTCDGSHNAPVLHVVAGNHDMAIINKRSTGPCCFFPDRTGSSSHISWRGSAQTPILAYDFTTGEALLNRLRVASPVHPQSALLACHIGVAAEDTPDFMRQASDVVDIRELAPLCASAGIVHVFAGNWHTPRTDTFMGVTVHQLGVLNPVGFGDGGYNRGRVAVYDTDSQLVEYLQVPGVRFIELESVEELSKLQDDPNIAELCIRLSVPLSEFSDANALVDLALAGAPAWVKSKLNSIDVRPQRAEVRARAVETIQSTAATVGLESTVRSFCASTFPEALSAGVADTALRYLRGG